MIGWRQGAASVDARFGISGEPADLGETALDGVPYGALAFAIERPLPKLPGDLFLAGQMGMDFIRLPYFDASDMYATLSVGWQGDFVARVPEKKPDVTPSAAVEPVAVPEAVPDLPSGILMQEKPLDWEVKLPAAADKLKDVDKAEYARRSDDLRKYALAQNWPGAAKTFKQLIELRDQKGVSLKYDDYKRGKDATQAQGDTMAYYQCLQWMAQTDPARSAEDLKTFESSWAYVSFQVDSKAQEDRSLRLETAFDPQSRNALAHVSEVYDATGTYEGFIPLQDGTAALGYYFGNLLVQIKPLAEDHNVQVFILK